MTGGVVVAAAGRLRRGSALRLPVRGNCRRLLGEALLRLPAQHLVDDDPRYEGQADQSDDRDADVTKYAHARDFCGFGSFWMMVVNRAD